MTTPCKCSKCQKEKGMQKSQGMPIISVRKDAKPAKDVKPAKPANPANPVKPAKPAKPAKDEPAKDAKAHKIAADKVCQTSCNESVTAKIDVKPEVSLKQIENKNRVSYEIELDLTARPNCRVVKKEEFDPVCGKTVIRQILLVEQDVKLGCTPKITQVSASPYAKYEMDVVVNTDTHIKK
jgi:hypothetical protein